ncbi:MAG: hypothetical protein AAB488_00475 [Patescibacteria group bacterium]
MNLETKVEQLKNQLKKLEPEIKSARKISIFISIMTILFTVVLIAGVALAALLDTAGYVREFMDNYGMWMFVIEFFLAVAMIISMDNSMIKEREAFNLHELLRELE